MLSCQLLGLGCEFQFSNWYLLTPGRGGVCGRSNGADSLFGFLCYGPGWEGGVPVTTGPMSVTDTVVKGGGLITLAFP